jgi:hypothetical protein
MAASGGVRAAHDDEERCGPSLCLLLLLRAKDFPFHIGRPGRRFFALLGGTKFNHFKHGARCAIQGA